MSNNGTLLPIPPGSELETMTNAWVAWWPQVEASGVAHPRSTWLTEMEWMLRAHYPASSSADRKLTARHVAPFPLALGPNVV